jgi:hypothetical protein
MSENANSETYNDLDDLVESATNSDGAKRDAALRRLAEALTDADIPITERYIAQVKKAGLMGKTAFRELLGQTRREQQRQARTEANSTDGDQVRIDAGDHNLPRVTAKVWAVLRKENDEEPFLFRFGRLASRIQSDDTSRPIITQVHHYEVRFIIARLIDWVKIGAAGVKSALPPMHVVYDLLATPDMPLPILRGIVSAPVFSAEGVLQTAPGFHESTGLFYAPTDGFVLPPVSDSPSTGDVARAKALILDDLLGDFPFVSDSERAHAVALFLLPFVRPMIAGATPLHLIEKPTPGTGATLLVDALTDPASGQPAAAMTEGRCEEEWRKRITAYLLSGASTVFLDNLRARLDSSALASAITTPLWRDRILGHSTIAHIPVRCVWIATGNNPALSNEMARRAIRIRLDARMDRPWLRETFKHENLRSWYRDNRARLVWAALTLVQNWVSEGMPPADQALGMFEDWARVMGGILDAAGISGFLDNVEELYDQADAEGAQWREFVARWWQKFGEESVGVADLSLLHAGVFGLMPPSTSREQLSFHTRLGMELREQRDRRYQIEIDGDTLTLKIEHCGSYQGANRWRLSPEQNGDPCDPCDPLLYGENSPGKNISEDAKLFFGASQTGAEKGHQGSQGHGEVREWKL